LLVTYYNNLLRIHISSSSGFVAEGADRLYDKGAEKKNHDYDTYHVEFCNKASSIQEMGLMGTVA
jgi:hypothetical protein